MKSPAQKERIYEMLKAETSNEKDSSWGDFKAKLKAEFLAVKVPPLELTRKSRMPKVSWQWLAPALVAASVAIGVIFFKTEKTSDFSSEKLAEKPVTRQFAKGNIFRSGKKEVRFLAGTAAVTENGEKITVEAVELTADFRLKQKVEMQIKHPLITVTITGTEFLFDAKAAGGSIRLREGSLAIEHTPGLSQPKKILLRAPAQFVFSAKAYEVLVEKEDKLTADKILYRYELTNGETFFAHQLKTDAKWHRVEVLGGKEQAIPVENIVRVEATENR